MPAHASLRASTFRPAEAPTALIDAWRGLSAQSAAFDGPLLGPDFALAVGECREDARVTVFERAGEPIGFLAYHLRPGGFARPIGSPFSDLHGLVSEAGADLRIDAALAAAGLSAYRATGLVDPFGVFGSGFTAGDERAAYEIRLTGCADDYLEGLRSESPKRFKNMRRLEHKLEREVGPLRLIADTDIAAFERTLAWKREQFRRTGAHDVLGPDWSRALMTRLFGRTDGDFRGLMLSLYAGDVHVGSHFGVRLGDHFHPWLASTNPDYAAYSPGQTFLMQAIAAMPAHGLAAYGLSHGHDHYKKPFVREPFMVGEGLATAASPSGAVARLREGTWDLPGVAGTAAAGRLKRRLDHIASVELSPAGRMRGLVEAFTARVMRSASAVAMMTGSLEFAGDALAFA
jgi:CelD/BcsL family acetyltransferase involved in cellulose biosynthesis